MQECGSRGRGEDPEGGRENVVAIQREGREQEEEINGDGRGGGEGGGLVITPTNSAVNFCNDIWLKEISSDKWIREEE